MSTKYLYVLCHEQIKCLAISVNCFMSAVADFIDSKDERKLGRNLRRIHFCYNKICTKFGDGFLLCSYSLTKLSIFLKSSPIAFSWHSSQWNLYHHKVQTSVVIGKCLRMKNPLGECLTEAEIKKSPKVAKSSAGWREHKFKENFLHAIRSLDLSLRAAVKRVDQPREWVRAKTRHRYRSRLIHVQPWRARRVRLFTNESSREIQAGARRTFWSISPCLGRERAISIKSASCRPWHTGKLSQTRNKNTAKVCACKLLQA